MLVLITYDVCTRHRAGRRRLVRVARICVGHGQRAQKSVFECHVDDVTWVTLRDRLLAAVDLSEDSLRFYHLGERGADRVEHHGVGALPDPFRPLIF